MSLNTIMTNFRYNETSFFGVRLFFVAEEVVGIGVARVRIRRAFEELLNVGLGSKSTHNIDHLKNKRIYYLKQNFSFRKYSSYSEVAAFIYVFSSIHEDACILCLFKTH